jgi:hypothetical protein
MGQPTITWGPGDLRPDSPEDLAYRDGEAQRQAEVVECADDRGHAWWLELEHPEDGSGISLSCEHCPAGFDDLYPDGVDAVNADVAGVEIAAGCHNSPVPLLIPVDCEVRTTHISNPIVGEDWDVEFTVAARGPARPVIWPPNQSNDNSQEG